ncbi:MAG: hypothetical protein ACTHKX_07150, partial [Pseudolysinimonas sp.]
AGLFGVTLTAPIGGIFTIPLVNGIPMYLLAGAIGTAVSAVMMGLLLKPYSQQPQVADAVLDEERKEAVTEGDAAK